jgi:hypothetical protein
MTTKAINVNNLTDPARLPFNRIAGILLIFEALLLFVPVIILGSAINWPASLSEPAQVVLPLINEQLVATRLGYTIYLLYSVLFFPLALLTTHALVRGERLGGLLQVAVGFAALSTLARSLGIIRWLVAMPALATAYVDPTATSSSRETIELIYTTLNAYGGSIGEVLGVNLFAALWLILLSLVGLRNAYLPRWLGIGGLLAAAGLFGGAIEMFGIDIGALITITTSGIQLWFLAAGIYLLRR